MLNNSLFRLFKFVEFKHQKGIATGVISASLMSTNFLKVKKYKKDVTRDVDVERWIPDQRHI